MTRFATAYDKLDAEWSGVLATRARRSVAAWTADFDEAREEQLALLERGLWRRGPDDFLIGRSRAELVHSAMVGWLLDPLGHHSVGPRLLSRVLARTRWEPGELSDVNVELEVSRTYVLPGKLMAEVSTFHTITGPPEVLDAEVSRAYQALIGAPLDAEPRVFGHGHAYAFGLEEADYRKWAFRSAFVSSRGEAPMVEELELMLLAGPRSDCPSGIALPTRMYDQRQHDFELETVKRLHKHGHSADLARRLVLTQRVSDVIGITRRWASGSFLS